MKDTFSPIIKSMAKAYINLDTMIKKMSDFRTLICLADLNSCSKTSQTYQSFKIAHSSSRRKDNERHTISMQYEIYSVCVLSLRLNDKRVVNFLCLCR